MSDNKYREWFLYESVSEDEDTLTAVPRGNDPYDQYANMITVIDKQAVTDLEAKLAASEKICGELVGALELWLKWEDSQINKDGAYVGKKINELIVNGNAALESYRKFKDMRDSHTTKGEINENDSRE